jgi:capsular exopolysaccharide synthesis family protein
MTAGSLDFWTLGSVVWRRKWSVLVSALIAATLAFGIALALPAKFSSEGGLVVESQRLNIPELGIQANQTADLTADAVATAIDVLNSRGTLESVVNALNLAHAPDLQPAMRLPTALNGIARLPQEWLAALKDLRQRYLKPDQPDAARDIPAEQEAAALLYLQRHIKVQANERSNLVTIQFEAGSPVLAADVVNALMANYIANDIAARRTQLRQANEWLTQRAADLRKELDADDQQINAYLKAHEIGQLQGGSVAVVQLSAARDRLAAARENLARLQASLDAVGTPGSRGGGAATSPAVLASPVVQALRQRESDLMQRLAALPPVHPDRAKLEDEIRSVRGQIGGETSKIMAGLAHDTEAARSNVQQLQLAADRAAADARSASVAQVDYEQLVHEADAKRQIYNAFVARADQTRLATMQFPSARVQFQATPDTVPNRASPMMLGFLGLFAGGILASAATVSGHLLRHRVTATADITAATGLPVYGSLPEIRLEAGPSRSRLAPPRRGQSLFEETLRAVWLSMHAMTPKSACTTVVVTSSEVGEGKTTVAAALARRVAEDGFRVLLIDADLRRGVPGSTGSANPASDLEAVLTGKVKFEDAVMVEPQSDLHCLMSGGSSANPIRLLASRDFKELLARARRDYDFVVLDGPPMMRVADAALLAEECLFTLFVVGYGRVSGSIVAEAMSRFPADATSKILPVLTRVPARRLDRLDYYGGYGGLREGAPVHGRPGSDVRLPARRASIPAGGGALRVVPRRTGTETQASDIVE